MSTLRVSPGRGRTIRQDPPAHLGDPTRPLLEEAVRGGRAAEAVEWLEDFLNEMASIRYIFGTRAWYMVGFVLDPPGARTGLRLGAGGNWAWIRAATGI